MFIVLEGTDASGKSSLTEAVEAEIKTRWPDRELTSFHKGKPEELTRRWVLNDYVLSVESKNTFKSISLSDRWHWGEITYAPKFRPSTNKDGYGLLGLAGWRWVELFMASRGIAQFWLYQPLEVIKRRLAVRGDDFVDVSDLSDILTQYHLAHAQTISCEKLTPSADSLDDVANLAAEIVDKAKLVAKEASVLEGFPQYIGVPKPKVLLVGDTPNFKKKYGEETGMAFMPVDGNSGEYLLSALPEELWRHVGLININDRRIKDPEFFGSLWEALGQPRIVALGRKAAQSLEKEMFYEDDDEFVVVPHPQWVRRFANDRKEEYGQAIARLATTNSKEDEWILQ